MTSIIYRRDIVPTYLTPAHAIGAAITLLALHNLYTLVMKSDQEAYPTAKKWVLFTGGASLLLHVATTPLAEKMARAAAAQLFTSTQLERILAANPERIVTIAAVALAAPSLVTSLLCLVGMATEPDTRANFSKNQVLVTSIFSTSIATLLSLLSKQVGKA